MKYNYCACWGCGRPIFNPGVCSRCWWGAEDLAADRKLAESQETEEEPVEVLPALTFGRGPQ